MARRVNHRRLVVAALLVSLAILPNVVHVYGALMYIPATQGGVVRLPTADRVPSPVVHVMLLDGPLFHIEVRSEDRAKAIGYRSEWFRQCWGIFAAGAACVLIWPFLPIRAIVGPDEED